MGSECEVLGSDEVLSQAPPRANKRLGPMPCLSEPLELAPRRNHALRRLT